MSEEKEGAQIRLAFSVSDKTILTSVFGSCFVLLAFMLFGLWKHRQAQDTRIRLVGESYKFIFHIIACELLCFLGLMSVHFEETIFHTACTFALCLLSIYFSHLGCDKYGINQNKFCFKLLFKIKLNYIFSGLIILSSAICWMYFEMNIKVNDNNDQEGIWNKEYIWFLIIMISIVLFHITISSIYSKISLAVFIILFPLYSIVLGSALLINEDNDDNDDSPYEYLLVYWFVFLFCLVSSISFFSCSRELKLRLISISLVGGFLSIFDLITDLILIITWFKSEDYFWVVLQVGFILSGTIFASFFIRRFYERRDDKNDNENDDDYNKYLRYKYMAHGFTLFGLGRLWHGILAWDLDTHSHVMLLTNKMIKIWEMFLESYPSICLQLWIVLSNYTLNGDDAQNAVVWSMVVSIASITFTVFRILYFDHRARRRNADELNKVAEDHVKQFGFENNQIVKAMKEIGMDPFAGAHDPEFIQEIVNGMLSTDIQILQPEPDEIYIDHNGNNNNHNRNPSYNIAAHDPNQKQQQQLDNVELIVGNKSSSDSRNNSIIDSSRDMDKKPPMISNIDSNSSIPNYPNYSNQSSIDRAYAIDNTKANNKLNNFHKQMSIERTKREILEAQKVKRGQELNKRRVERKKKLQISELTIKWEEKPLGCTLFQGDNDDGLNAWVADIKETNMKVSQGLRIGLYVHKVNDQVVDNMQYNHILQLVRNTPPPLNVGFNNYPPLYQNDSTSANREKYKNLINLLGCTWLDIQYAWKQCCEKDPTFTTNHEEFDTRMTSKISEMNYIDPRQIVPLCDNPWGIPEEEEKVSYHHHHDEANDTDSQEHDDMLPGIFYTQDGLQRDYSDSEDEEKFPNQKHLSEQEIVINMNNGTDEYNDFMENKYNDDNDNKHDHDEMKITSPGGPMGNSPGGLDLNIAELYMLVPIPNPDDLITLKFRRKPLGFDREVGDERFELNCRVRAIHKQKLVDNGLKEGYYIRKINDRFVGRLKFVAIESLLRNTACPMTIVFRKHEPPLNKEMQEKLERREKEKIRQKIQKARRRASRKSWAKKKVEMISDIEKDVKKSLDKGKKEVTIFYNDPKAFAEKGLQFQISPQDNNFQINAIVTKVGYSLLDTGLRLNMFVHKIDNKEIDNLRFDKIQKMLKQQVKIPFSVTFCSYKPIDTNHQNVRRLLEDHYTPKEIKEVWRYLNRRKIDGMISMDDDDFYENMIEQLKVEKQVTEKYLAKMKANKAKKKLVAHDLDINKPITIYFTQRPLGFSVQSGDELANGKNAKIKQISNNQYKKIGLKIGMLIHTINDEIVDNKPFEDIASLLHSQQCPMTITFVKSIALANLKYVIEFDCPNHPLGIRFVKAAQKKDNKNDCAMVDKIVNPMAAKDIKKGMYIHNINGIDVMNKMKFDDIQQMLMHMEYPIKLGFIDMKLVAKREKEKEKRRKKEFEMIYPLKRKKSKKKDMKNMKNMSMELEGRHNMNGLSGSMQINPKLVDQIQNPRSSNVVKQPADFKGIVGWESCSGCLDDIFTIKNLYYLIFYLFTISDMYCRIYSMLLIMAYTKRSTENDPYLQYLQYIVALLVATIVSVFELIAYRYILLPDYKSWKTVLKQLYFATFTISFFLLSTMGLAYLEKNVDFNKMMKVEYIGRQLIGLIFVLIVTIHQFVASDEPLFGPTIYIYFALLALSLISGSILYKKHHLL